MVMAGPPLAAGPSPQGPGNIRLRRWLAEHLDAPVWPDGFVMRAFEPADAAAVHTLLVEVLDEQERSLDVWWADRSGDAEFERRCGSW